MTDKPEGGRRFNDENPANIRPSHEHELARKLENFSARPLLEQMAELKREVRNQSLLLIVIFIALLWLLAR